MELEPERIRARLRQAREEAGFTQQQLADVLGVHKRSVENYENLRVPWDLLNEYARATNRSSEWFIYGETALPPEGEVAALTATVEHMTSDLRELQERIDVLEAR
jgi:transcriptional regulator with XRE-family HTH domain